jgi:3'(2'), 5'-bisphosphate nucleotidase
MTNWSNEIRIASTLARQAGEVIMNIYKKDFLVSYKGTNDPVTEADQLANTLIVEGLATHFPEIVSQQAESGMWILWMEPKNLFPVMESSLS